LNPLNLAFVGDAVYELMVRERLLRNGGLPMQELHGRAVRYVCAQAQSAAYDILCGELTEEEAQVLRRGRNSSAIRAPKSSSMMEYRRSTGVEALLGYLYLKGEDARLEELAEIIFEVIERGTQEEPAPEEAYTL
jgi:ribonuclease-3 family protein